jgi:dephospho-CoA kinase
MEVAMKYENNNSNNNTHRIVVTGGPGGGKSTAADLIRRELGSDIVVVPEAATLLFSGGFPRYDETGAKVAAQKAIYPVRTRPELEARSL